MIEIVRYIPRKDLQDDELRILMETIMEETMNSMVSEMVQDLFGRESNSKYEEDPLYRRGLYCDDIL